ncbi:MAG: hypothetical protein RLZZ200_1342 [Pseudomonadota bacterium]|jgi:hypothetical protein
MNISIPRLALIAGLGLLTACADVPQRGDGGYGRRVADEVPPPPPSRVYFYPTQGQGPEQQDRDRYECYNWAVKQTGFDPGRSLPAQERVTVVPSRAPGETTVGAAIAGAVIGAVVSNPHNAGTGAVVGAAAGGILGAAAEDSQQRQIERIQSRRGDERQRRDAAEYRRAMSACLEGRGYSVK